ncbi:unnamed protein product, partial [Candidula unifasciata]
TAKEDVESKNNQTINSNSDSKDDEEQTKTRNSGPIKALPPETRGDDDNKMVLSRFLSVDSERSSGYQQHTQISKDDSLMTPAKEKVHTNPYATMKIWRPTSTVVGTTSKSNENVYHSFTNFDALRMNSDPEWEVKKERITAAGNNRSLLNQELSYHRSYGHSLDRNRLGMDQISRRDNPAHVLKTAFSSFNGYDELPADYSRDNSPTSIFRRVSFREEITTGISQHNEDANGSPITTAETLFLLSSPPSTTSPCVNSDSQPPSVKETKHDTSFQVVSDGTTNSVKLVLSHSYSEIDLVGKDIERLLAELKLTMDSLLTSRIDKNQGQLSMCLSELQVQTKQFIQEAKMVVSSASHSHELMVQQLNSAVHTLAHVFLHGQAAMLLMILPDRAKHMGFQIIKAANSFKSTVSAANLALGKSLSDPNMKYLMRQAQNLATLLASLMSTIKEVQMELS